MQVAGLKKREQKGLRIFDSTQPEGDEQQLTCSSPSGPCSLKEKTSPHNLKEKRSKQVSVGVKANEEEKNKTDIPKASKSFLRKRCSQRQW